MRNQSALVAASALVFSVGAENPKYARPPEVYVDRGACPGECCTYGIWRAVQLVDLYEAPTQDSRAIGRVDAGSDAYAETGEVHTRAGKFIVRKQSPPNKVGDVIWVYTYLGEGYYTVWLTGAMVTQELSVIPNHRNPDDWGYFARSPESLWWVKLRKANGSKGWTNAPEKFSGTHSCG